MWSNVFVDGVDMVNVVYSAKFYSWYKYRHATQVTRLDAHCLRKHYGKFGPYSIRIQVSEIVHLEALPEPVLIDVSPKRASC